MPKSIAYGEGFGSERYCLSNGRMGYCARRESLLQLLSVMTLARWLDVGVGAGGWGV
jgi:hypothetical protein